MSEVATPAVTAESIMAGLNASADIKDDGDFLGGYNPFETDLYDFTITLAYFGVSPGGAKCLNVTLVQDKRELKQQFWITSGTAKGCLPYYTNKKTGEKAYLPGFTVARHISKLGAGGKELDQLVVEKKHIKLYNREQKKEIPTEVLMCTELIGKPITCGVIKRLVDKTKDTNTVDATGKKVYAPTGEFRTENEIVKIFRTRDRMTVTEIEGKAEKAEFATRWLDKWFGQVEDKRTQNAGVAGGVATPGTAPAPVSSVSADLFA
jgi:hypothetical protein